MSEKRVLSPTEVEDGGWRGRVVGVTRIGGKAGFVATCIAALFVMFIAYGISTSGHHHPLRVTAGVPLTKASEVHTAWWESMSDMPSSPPPLPTSPPRRAMPVRRQIQVRREFVVQPQVPEVLPIEAAPLREPRRVEPEKAENPRQALHDAAVSAPVTVRLDDRADAASIPIIPETMQGRASGSSTSSDASGQEEHLAFLANAAAGASRDRLLSDRRGEPSPFVLRAGSVIPATLLTGVNADLPGLLVAQVREDVFDSVTGWYRLIPNGTKIIGAYDSHVVQGQNRLLVVWNRLLYPDGSNLDLRGMAGVDPSGYAGFDAKVDTHRNKMFSSALLLSIIGAGAQLSQPQRSVIVGAPPDIGQTIAGAMGQQIANDSIQLAQRQMQIPPTLTVTPGYRFDVLVDRDIVLSRPYDDERGGEP
jgi:type IV secretory pathway VirB10-like protein